MQPELILSVTQSVETGWHVRSSNLKSERHVRCEALGFRTVTSTENHTIVSLDFVALPPAAMVVCGVYSKASFESSVE